MKRRLFTALFFAVAAAALAGFTTPGTPELADCNPTDPGCGSLVPERPVVEVL